MHTRPAQHGAEASHALPAGVHIGAPTQTGVPAPAWSWHSRPAQHGCAPPHALPAGVHIGAPTQTGVPAPAWSWHSRPAQHGAEASHALPAGVHIEVEPSKSTVIEAFPLRRMLSVSCATLVASIIATTGSATKVGAEPAGVAAQPVANAWPEKVTAPTGSPLIDKTELAPDMTSKLFSTLRDPLARIRTHATSVGTTVSAISTRPVLPASPVVSLHAAHAKTPAATTTNQSLPFDIVSPSNAERA
jgi:hypothetical protein